MFKPCAAKARFSSVVAAGWNPLNLNCVFERQAVLRSEEDELADCDPHKQGKCLVLYILFDTLHLSGNLRKRGGDHCDSPRGEQVAG
jgi:hypothetical protein